MAGEPPARSGGSVLFGGWPSAGAGASSLFDVADDQRTIGSGELLPHLARGIAGWLVAALVASLALPEHQQAPAAWIAALAICLLTLRAIRADRTRAAAEGSAPSGRGPASS